MTVIGSLEEVRSRCDWTLTTDDEALAEAALEDASHLARHIAERPSWDDTNAPPMVKSIILNAVKRYLVNPQGYVMSRSGTESVTWAESLQDRAGGFYFTEEEKGMLRKFRASAQNGLHTVQVMAYNSGTSTTPYRLPVDYGGRSFPWGY